MEEENKEDIGPDWIKEIGPVESYVYGLMVAFVAFLLIAGGSVTASQTFSVTALIFGSAIAIGIFLAGLRKVKVAHKAVPTLFGKRVYLAYTEGVVWILPLLMGLIEVKVQEVNTIVGDDDKLKIISINTDETETEKKNRTIELKVKIMVRWVIENVYLIQNIDRETVEKNIVEFSKSALREYAGHTDGIKLITDKDDAQSTIERAFMEKVQEVAADWGIRILDFTLAKVAPANDTFIAALEAKAREIEEGDGYLTEAQKAIKQMEFMAKEFKRMEGEGLPIQDARELILTMQGKSTMQFIKGLEGNKNVMANVSTGGQSPSK